jgi:biopolymer transport protein ExbD
MAEIMNNSDGIRKGHEKRRAKKLSTHIDMTPMVDLMSLLITFFMLTTAFSKLKTMEIVLPNDGIGAESPAPRTLNVLLAGGDSIYYYIGMPPKNDEEVSTTITKLSKTDYSKDGIRKVVLKMNMQLYQKIDSATQQIVSGEKSISTDSLLALVKEFKKTDKVGPIIMIKADDSASYKNIVDIIDEMAICNVARYAIVDMNEYETKLLKQITNNF